MANESGVFINKDHGTMGLWVTIHEYGAEVLVGVGSEYDFISKSEAIAAARAILKHYNVGAGE